MTWKRIPISDIDLEKDIITGIITNTHFLKEISQIYSQDIFQISYAKIIIKWCIDYYDNYGECPNSNIQEIFNGYKRKQNTDESQIELIEKFLSNLSDKYVKGNTEYHIDIAEKYFRKRKINILKEKLGMLLLENRIEECEKEIGDYKRPAMITTTGVDIIHGNINQILNQENEILFQFPGHLGEMISPFTREDFVGIAAPMKRGKTFWLIELGIKGMMRGNKVLFYSLESSEQKIIKRIYQNLLGESNKEREIEWPYFNEDTIEYKTITKKGITQPQILKKKKQIQTMINEGFWVACFPTYSINVDDIKIHLDNLQYYENYVPDIIIVDYADILGPEKNSSKEERHKLNNTWLALRGLAQERKVLMITGTQLTKATFNRDANEEDIAEDIRKLAHVTHMIALNQSREDKKKSIMRVSMLVVRDDQFYVDEEMVVLECKEIGKPYLDARWKKDVKL